MSLNICEDCAKYFLSKTRAKKRCPKCERKHEKEMWKIYKANHKGQKDDHADGIERQWRRWFKNPPKIEEDPAPAQNSFELKYCANYREDELSCIKCYENQTAPYKGCYKKGGKYDE